VGVASLAVGFVGIVVSCGGQHHPPYAGDTVVPDEEGGSTGDLIGGDSGAAVCNTLLDGSSCGCQDVPLFADPPTMYFVLDRSGSMADSNKWTTVRLTVADVVRSIGPRANFGAAVFPGASNVDQCASGVEVMSVRRGDPKTTDGLDGPVTTALLQATAIAATGGTPTSATLTALMPNLAALKGNLFVVLATDGGPNCNQMANCTIADCIPNIEGAAGCDSTTNCCAPPKGTPSNCLDDQATIAAVNKLKAANIPTYVIGIPGSAPYANVLDALATAGGTAQTTGTSKYYRVDTTDQTALLAALKSVAAKVTATCTFKLQGNVDPTRVNVLFDEVVVPQDATNGWTIADNTITLQGTSCQQVLNGDVLDVRIIAGCPTIVK
jgi:hypothetical protein